MIIWPTTSDIHKDDELSMDYSGRGSVIVESQWSQRWTDLSPVSRGSWIAVPFLSSQTFPTGGTTLTVDRGVAIVDGFVVDFRGEDADISFTIPTSVHCYVYLTLSFDGGGLVDGYDWNLDTTAQLRLHSICVGQAICSTEIEAWHPISYPEGPRVAIGDFHTGIAPKLKPVVLGFQPLRAKTGTDDTLEVYGFSIDATNENGSFEAITFDHFSG